MGSATVTVGGLRFESVAAARGYFHAAARGGGSGYFDPVRVRGPEADRRQEQASQVVLWLNACQLAAEAGAKGDWALAAAWYEAACVAFVGAGTAALPNGPLVGGPACPGCFLSGREYSKKETDRLIEEISAGLDRKGAVHNG